ncbi:hypothetical protein NQ318_009325 [Aromia moschata]|uniref:Uncharacterized protein n=1 Tax=Aromia moschata TaxID=1265417 RepID=A0AAV8XF99_9CUCU|nr:hypothetical protein NQ318_009325 [Aromia moschata]
MPEMNRCRLIWGYGVLGLWGYGVTGLGGYWIMGNPSPMGIPAPDSDSATPKTCSKHGLTPEPENDFFLCGCVISKHNCWAPTYIIIRKYWFFDNSVYKSAVSIIQSYVFAVLRTLYSREDSDEDNSFYYFSRSIFLYFILLRSLSINCYLSSPWINRKNYKQSLHGLLLTVVLGFYFTLL